MSLVPADLGDSPDLGRIVLAHANRGVRLQLVLRGGLVVFLAGTLAWVPPNSPIAPACWAILGCYAAWTVALIVVARSVGPATVDRMWLTLFVDLAVVAALVLLTGLAAQQSWTADTLGYALFAIPVLACTQLRPLVCFGVVAPTVVVFLLSAWATDDANAQPWSSIAMSTLAMALLSAGAVRLSAIQRSRVRTIGRLARDRSALLLELIGLEQRERRSLSEQLHDGALQYVLAARHDLAELHHGPDPELLARVEHALAETSTLLRTTVSELHPAVLERLGLARALRDLARATEARGGFPTEARIAAWPDALHTDVDDLLFAAARELLTNVVKHAGASSARVTLERDGDDAVLTVADDGRGIAAEAREKSLAGGHIGLASTELRVVAAGGTFRAGPGPRGGTVVWIGVPLTVRPVAVGAR
ncbi:sensor histidine kinase [Speluncibacter jeojiensis]|uniref:ATP-binding protein n=1 Tax=Speluncibacter jeojiensis TaxID=2710754 RepID=A0A9X4REV8_9ACTN|nr:ATP-binding protein [Corynebacteriales bacterium D3-21]